MAGAEKAVAVYVVQRRIGADQEPMIEPPVWEDVATVTVPARSKRATVIEAALRSDAGKRVTLPVTVRVLDVDAAREHPVGLREREPELVIG
jgi:hypothetical protein